MSQNSNIKKEPEKLLTPTLNIAPTSLIQKNIKSLNYIFDGPKELRESLFPTALKILSTQGHMTKGHKLANGVKYEDTSPLDVLKAYYTDSKNKQHPYKEKKLRETLTQEIIATNKFYEEALDILFNKRRISSSNLYDPQTHRLKIVNPKTGDFLFPFNLIKETRLPLEKKKLLEVIKAGVKGFEMDSEDYRIETVKRFKVNLAGEPLQIGTGSCHVGDLNLIKKKKISLEKLANEEITPDEINWLYKNHYLVRIKDFKNYERHKNNLFPVFIRGNEGYGCCDDLTTLGIGFQLHPFGEKTTKAGYSLARLSDYIDTFDKLSLAPITHGADQLIAKNIAQKYQKLAYKENLQIAQDFMKNKLKKRVTISELEENLPNEITRQTLQNFIHKKGAVVDLSQIEEHLFPSQIITNEEMTRTIFFGAKNNYPKILISDSVRRFEELQYSSKEKGVHYSPSSAHLKYLLTGNPTEGLKYGFENISSKDFYEIVNSRLTDFVEANLFPNPFFR